MLIALSGGFLAGTLIAILTLLVEHSRIAFGSYALYGNGALVVPAVLAPFAIYPGWLWTLRRGGRALELALFVLGLHFGIGLTTILEVLFFPQEDGLGLLFALHGFLFIGAIFVLPAALLAASSYGLLARLRGALLVVATLVLVAVATFFGGALRPWARRARGRRRCRRPATVIAGVAARRAAVRAHGRLRESVDPVRPAITNEAK